MADELTSLTKIDTTTLFIGGTSVSSTPAELNILDGATFDVNEANRALDVSARLIDHTSASLTITAASHASRIISLNRAAGVAVTLPAATATGNIYTFIIATTVTSNTTTISAASASDAFDGSTFTMQDNDVDGTLSMWKADAGDDTITMNGTTTGGFKGTKIEVIDGETGFFTIHAWGIGSGTLATPFSAAV